MNGKQANKSRETYWQRRIVDTLERLRKEIELLKKGGKKLMSIVDDIRKQMADAKTSIQGVGTDLATLVAEVQALKDQVAAGSPATVADLQNILTDATDLAASVKTMDDAIPGAGSQP